MEILFTYETAKYTLVMAGYWLLICLECWWIGYLIVSTVKWCFKKSKAIIAIFKKPKAAPTEDVTDEQ
jgi:hypothetical protein